MPTGPCLVGLSVEYTVLRLPEGCGFVTDPSCEINPTDCCPPQDPDDCCGSLVADDWVMTITGPSGCTCATITVPLLREYNTQSRRAAWEACGATWALSIDCVSPIEIVGYEIALYVNGEIVSDLAVGDADCGPPFFIQLTFTVNLPGMCELGPGSAIFMLINS